MATSRRGGRAWDWVIRWSRGVRALLFAIGCFRLPCARDDLVVQNCLWKGVPHPHRAHQLDHHRVAPTRALVLSSAGRRGWSRARRGAPLSLFSCMLRSPLLRGKLHTLHCTAHQPASGGPLMAGSWFHTLALTAPRRAFFLQLSLRRSPAALGNPSGMRAHHVRAHRDPAPFHFTMPCACL